MMTTKAYIKSLPNEDTNMYTVEIPLMEDNTGNEAIFEAALSYTPGIYNGLKEGDCVFVTFEDDKYNTAIIVGKLYTEDNANEPVYASLDSLNVTGSVVLPEDTKIGNYSVRDIVNLYNGVENAGGGGGTGTLNPDDLKQYVQWLNTERTVSGSTVDIYADHIKVMTGQEYNDYKDSQQNPDYDEELFNHTLFFLSSLPPNT